MDVTGQKPTRVVRHDAFCKCRHKAGVRGIPFELTFEEWDSWWGDDFLRRGNNEDSLQMCRKGDKGGYSLDNIYKATKAQNRRDMVENKSTSNQLPQEVHEHIRSLKGSTSTRKAAQIVGCGKSLVHKVWKAMGEE